MILRSLLGFVLLVFVYVLSGCMAKPSEVTISEGVKNPELCPSLESGVSVTNGEDRIDFKVGSIIAMCNGWVLVADQTANTIQKRNVYNGTVEATFQLSATPVEFAIDSKLKALFVTHGPVTFISKVSLLGGEVVTMPVKSGARSVATNNNGKVFVNHNSGSVVDVIDGASLLVLKSVPNMFSSYLQYNEATKRLITGSHNYYFDDVENSFALQGVSSGGGDGSDCDRVVVSQDGDHAVKVCGAGNGTGYTVYDFYSFDPSIVFGEWNTGAYPSGVAFGPSNKYVLLTNRSEIQLFSVDTHKLITNYPAPFCSYGDTRKLSISRDGKSLYSVTQCGFDKESAIITWSLFDTMK